MIGKDVFSQKERNIIILIIILVLGAVILYAMKGIFGAILGTMVMYTLFRNLNIFLMRSKLKTGLSKQCHTYVKIRTISK